MKTNRRFLILITLNLASLALAQAPAPPLVGQKVVTKLRTSMMIGDELVPVPNAFLVYTVEKTNGEWLWLVSGGRQGWVRPSDVIPFDQAIDYYTKEVMNVVIDFLKMSPVKELALSN